MKLKQLTTAAIIGATLAVGAPSALAQSSSEEGYSQPAGVVQTQLDRNPRPTPTPNDRVTDETPARPAAVQRASSGRLPFTGLDLALVVGAGGMLVALGFGIRRLSRSSGIA